MIINIGRFQRQTIQNTLDEILDDPTTAWKIIKTRYCKTNRIQMLMHFQNGKKKYITQFLTFVLVVCARSVFWFIFYSCSSFFLTQFTRNGIGNLWVRISRLLTARLAILWGKHPNYFRFNNSTKSIRISKHSINGGRIEFVVKKVINDDVNKMSIAQIGIRVHVQWKRRHWQNKRWPTIQQYIRVTVEEALRFGRPILFNKNYGSRCKLHRNHYATEKEAKMRLIFTELCAGESLFYLRSNSFGSLGALNSFLFLSCSVRSMRSILYETGFGSGVMKPVSIQLIWF